MSNNVQPTHSPARWLGTLALLTVVSCGQTSSSRYSSAYTDLSGTSCSLVTENKETGATSHRCPGVEGWNLLVLYDDQSMSVTVVQPDGREHPLNYWSVITRGYSSLGPRAEWRLLERGASRKEPVALIVRVNARESQGSATRTVSYLTVARLGSSSVCVTARIPPGTDSNERARRAADAAGSAPCL